MESYEEYKIKRDKESDEGIFCESIDPKMIVNFTIDGKEGSLSYGKLEDFLTFNASDDEIEKIDFSNNSHKVRWIAEEFVNYGIGL